MSKPDIKKMFAELNKEYFEDSIPKIPVVWNNRLRVCAGKCKFIRRRGKLSVTKIEMANRVFSNNGWKINQGRETLIHEMVHAYLIHHHEITGHGKQFQDMMKDILNKDINHTYHSYDLDSLVEDNKWLLVCNYCKKTLGKRKRRRNNLYHKGCGGTIKFKPIHQKRSISLI